MVGVHLWPMKRVVLELQILSRELLLRLRGLTAAPDPSSLSLPVSPCTVPAEPPVASRHCSEHLPYFAIALGQTEISWSSQHVLLFVNGSKLRKHWKSTVLRGKRKYRGFVPARKSGTKLSPRVIYYPFLGGWFSHRSLPHWACRPLRIFLPKSLQAPGQVLLKFFARSWPGLLSSRLNLKSTIFINKCFLWRGCCKVAASRVCFSRKWGLFLLSNVC